MGKVIDVKYSGEIGFFATIREVVDYLRIKCTLEEFLKFKRSDGFENSQIIFSSYDDRTKIKYNLMDDSGNEISNHTAITGEMVCPHPIVFYIDSDFVEIDLIVNQSNLLYNLQNFDGIGEDGNYRVDLNSFYRQFIQFTEDDETPTNRVEDGKSDLRKQAPNPKVWIWCKTLNENGVFNEYSVFDLSPFVQNINISQTETGGNFSVNLLPIDGFIKLSNNEITGIWMPKKERYLKFNSDSKSNYLFKRLLDIKGEVKDVTTSMKTDRYQGNVLNNVSYANTVDDGKTTAYIHNEVFFKNLISENDIIFISFDDKKMETSVQGNLNEGLVVNVVRDRRTGEQLDELIKDDFFVHCDEIYKRGWDMIGLIDSNNLQLNYESNEQDLNINGRDLMKLLLEDGSYFFAKSYSSEDSNSIFNNVNLPNSGDGNNTTNKRIKGVNPKGINRLVTNGIIDMLYNAEARNVQFVLNLLISRLANIEVCPSDVFKSYGDERTEFLIPNFIYQEDDDNAIKQEDADGD